MTHRMHTAVWAAGAVAVLGMSPTWVQAETGSIVGWGSQVVGGDLSGGFIALTGGVDHSLGLKADGSIVPWGDNYYGQCDVPAPNSGFIAVAAGELHSLGLKRISATPRLSSAFSR